MPPKCDYCDKSHRTEEALEKCKVRAERREAREKKVAADKARRESNARNVPPAQFIRERMAMGGNWTNVVAFLNREYPPPPNKPKWDLATVIELDSQRLKWGREPYVSPYPRRAL